MFFSNTELVHNIGQGSLYNVPLGGESAYNNGRGRSFFCYYFGEKKKNCQPATCARLQMAHKDSLSDTSVVRCFLDVFCRMVLI